MAKRTSQSSTPRRAVARSESPHSERASWSSAPRYLTGSALLEDMARYGKELLAEPSLAKQFLRELGVLTKSGRRKSLIRRR